MITRRRGLLGGCLSVIAALREADAKQPVAMLIGVPEGTGASRIARDFATCFQSHLGAIELEPRNVPGEGGHVMLATLAATASSAPTIGWVSTPTLPARMIDRSDPSLIRRIRLLGMIEREPVAFVSPASNPVDSVQAIINRAGDDADAVPLATPPAGSPPHLAAVRLQALSQTRLNIVTFPSAAAATQAVLAANVSAAALGLSDVIDGVRDGRLSTMGIAAGHRFAPLPDIPILSEAGVPLAASISRGIAVPVGAPSDLTDALVAAMRAVTEDDEFRAQAETSGYHVEWKDGPTWLAQMHVEQDILSKLWATDPWLSSSGG